MRSLAIAASIFMCALAAPQSADAWDDHGHRIVALVADHYLTPEVRDRINGMLAASTDALAPANIVGAATWAADYMESDEYTTRERYDGTRQWHYAKIYANRPSIPNACFGQMPLPENVPASKGPAEACVIDKIDQFKAELADPNTDPAERLLALKFLLHLVGDVHSPVHVTDNHNEFGTLVPVAAEDGSITPGTLFGHWDRAFVHRLGNDPHQVAARLISQITDEDIGRWSGRVTHVWALEAHQIGTVNAFGTMLGDFRTYPQGHYVLTVEEMNKARDLVAEQLSKAGVRLAQLLNTALSPTPVPAVAVSLPKPNIRGGRELAIGVCAVCHRVEEARTPKQWTDAPDFTDIANTRDMSPVVLREFLFGPHPTMPSLFLSGEETTDVIGYIMSLKTRP